MAKFLDLDGLKTFVDNIATFIQNQIQQFFQQNIESKYMEAPATATYNTILPGFVMHCTSVPSTSTSAPNVRIGNVKSNTPTTFNSYLYLRPTAAELTYNDSYIRVTATSIYLKASSYIYFNVGGTNYKLNVAKAKELGVLS